MISRMAGIFTKLSELSNGRTLLMIRRFSISSFYRQSVQPLELPPVESEDLVMSPKIESLINQIGSLTILEVTELNIALKKKFNLPDFAPAAVNSAVQETRMDDQAPVAMKSSFSVKLQKFDDSKKVALIKEIKAVLSDLNLVQAKKFVESAPVVVKGDISKAEAETLKETLEKAGAECSID